MAHDQDPGYVLAAGSLMVIGCSLVLIIGVDKKVLAYPTPAPKDLQDPDDEHSVNFTTVEKMSTSRKFAVLAVFGLGAVALVASIIRLALFVNITGIASGKIKDPNADNDLLTTRSLFWSMLESGLALIACCLPSLNYLAGLPPFRSVIDSFRNITSIRSSSEHYKMSQGNDNSQLKAEDQSLASRKALVPESADSAEIETYAMGDVPKINHGRRAGKDGIWVDKVVEQENYIV
ncbi:predicted protein [Sclerotinia sclerotiorum 1980 UF-70]|uniref:Rhodopsin domain-containing protein n=1 Tax=Sclerotinia sclerotiorum (strain ATCC 18683 / 1980 / Ss-1) TaxID=665079 RepID=A7EZY6_SCLS1|nr:predicted protein [Sclerotinia sclerotiorum 1980 UF-70]EDN95028.1 predicted protein [Sclerotinia sclerotiorum 1980 UF-70]